MVHGYCCNATISRGLSDFDASLGCNRRFPWISLVLTTVWALRRNYWQPGSTIYNCADNCALRGSLRNCEEPLNRSVRPWLFAPSDAFRDLGLKCRGTEGKPVLFDLIDQEPLVFRSELHQPVQRFSLGTGDRRDHHIDRQAVPGEIGGKHDHV